MILKNCQALEYISALLNTLKALSLASNSLLFLKEMIFLKIL